MSKLDHTMDETKIIQLCLDALVPDVVTDNGHFGHYTEKLIRSFQERNNLPANGIVDEDCFNKMKGKQKYR